MGNKTRAATLEKSGLQGMLAQFGLPRLLIAGFLRQGLACRRKAMQAVLAHEPLDFFTLSSLLTISWSNSNFLSGYHHGAARWGYRALQMVLCKLKTLSLFALTSLSGFP